MTPEKLYALIYSIAPDMDLSQEELENLLCNADEIADIGTDDLHALAYELANRGFLDEKALNNYLAAADRIADEKK